MFSEWTHLESIDESFTESSLDSGTGDEHIGGMLGEEDEHLSVMMSSMECPDDTHDYMLNREVQRIGVFADQAVSKNPLMELGQAEKFVLTILSLVAWSTQLGANKIKQFSNILKSFVVLKKFYKNREYRKEIRNVLAWSFYCDNKRSAEDYRCSGL